MSSIIFHIIMDCKLT